MEASMEVSQKTELQYDLGIFKYVLKEFHILQEIFVHPCLLQLYSQ